MAEGEAEGRSPLLPRSVSFKRLERPPGLDDAAPPPSAGAPPAEPVGRRAPGRAASFSVSRGVAKLAASSSSSPPDLAPPSTGASASRAGRSHSPSVRQLSQRFGAPPSRRAPEATAAPCGGAAAREPPDGAGGEPPPRGCAKAPGEPPKTGEAPSDWPRVTEMRKLFGEGFLRRHQQHDAGDSAGPARLPGPDAKPESCKSPPPPPPRSCIPFRTHRLPVAAPRAEPERQPPLQLWDSLHSWHSSPKPPAPWPSSAASSAGCSLGPPESSGSRETLPGLRSPCPERSSWSEEEEGRLASPRKSSLPKTKEERGGLEHGSGGDGLAGMEWHRKAQEDLSGDLALLAEPRTRPFFEAKRVAADTTPGVASPAEAGLGSGVEGHRQLARGLSEGAGVPPAPLSSASPLPLVSRVSKVNIPPFVPSPCGSRSSSRYSSTETLKDEDHFGASWTGQSRSFQGVFRSPSFSQSESLARLQSQVRARPKLPSGFVRTKPDLPGYEPLLRCAGEPAEKPRHMKSMSNPDIATETLTLLSFLKSDLSELKARKKNGRLSDQEGVALSGDHGQRENSHTAAAGHQLVGRAQSEGQPPARWALGNRPTLKDLTATLRRAKSFTYSDKPPPRRLFYQSTMKQSSSELLLATGRDHEGAFSDGEIGRDVDDGMPVVIQDQYIQEARQVFEKISRIGSQNDYNFGLLDQKESGNSKGEGEDEKPLGRPEGERRLGKADSDGDGLRRKSSEELSGRESSMADEGIVTELETCPAYRYLDPPVAAWSVNQRENEAGLAELKGVRLSSHLSKTQQEKAMVVDEALPKVVSQGLSEAPSTPGALRRRRKFPSVGSGGSESSNGSNGESNGETYRSLSDPMPHRRHSITEDSKNFSVDSNLLGSLNSKSGLPEYSAVALSECTGSAASDLSVCSDSVKDYSTVIQNIVSQPGAMDKVIDEKGNGKTIKKKSFSDPSRRSELASPGFDGPGEPISEMDQVIPPSISEPILSEREQTMGKDQEVRKLYSQSEHLLTTPLEDDVVEVAQSYGFDPKLVEVLSPRIVRRSSKKRSNRVNGHENQKDEATPSTTVAALGTQRPATKHVRHTSEPATFIPISEVNLPASLNLNADVAVPESSRPPAKPYPVLQAPSLEDVTKHYMLALHSGEASPTNVVDMPRSSPATPTTSEPRLPRCPKHHEEPSARTKPQV
ncbi:rho guanine nucleotide exchange factor 17-like, partial [Heteronotia binoei]|uniref:rho guanine nucleotide exchange factor 17-like n=1 Tax=Heteronotia binoei TaxID=13085 RepID=UPI00292D44E1